MTLERRTLAQAKKEYNTRFLPTAPTYKGGRSQIYGRPPLFIRPTALIHTADRPNLVTPSFSPCYLGSFSLFAPVSSPYSPCGKIYAPTRELQSLFYCLNASFSASMALPASCVSSKSFTNLEPMMAPAALACAASRVCLLLMPKPIMQGCWRFIDLMREK